MRTFVIVFTLLLSACAAVPIENASAIRTETALADDISTPIEIPVAYYADGEELSRLVKTFNGYYTFRTPAGTKFKEALELVFSDVFPTSSKLSVDSQFEYLFTFESEPGFSNSFGSVYSVALETTVLNRNGDTLFTTTTSSSVSGAVADSNAYLNAYAKALKEAIYQFLNEIGSPALAAATTKAATSEPYGESKIDIKSLLGDIKPTNTGTGFFIDSEGYIVSAAHVVNDCILTEIQAKGEKYEAEIVHISSLLDIAVLKTEKSDISIATISDKAGGAAYLGQQIFATGFPLAGILSEYPSLTIGNVSSLGGLKGAKGTFQFSAPIQPGNSGGPISDYGGNVVGMVTSTLNQRMMLRAAGTTSQNVNFGLTTAILTAFLDKNNIPYSTHSHQSSFEDASKRAVEYTNQVLCYK